MGFLSKIIIQAARLGYPDFEQALENLLAAQYFARYAE
jgi:hypothetical protein